MLNFLVSRKVKHGSNTLVALLMVLGILVVVNILSNRYYWRIDTTKGALHSLSDQTVMLLGSLKKEVNVVGFFKDQNRPTYELMLKEYAYHSGRFSYRFVDPDKDPIQRKRYGIESYNTSVIEVGNREERITSTEEKDLTNAIARAIKDEERVIYFLTGHGEASTLRQDRLGFNSVTVALENANYSVNHSLMLVKSEKVPEDCSLLIVAGPKSEIFQTELNSIQDYLTEGGAGMFLLDPGVKSGLELMLEDWSVRVNNDFIVDENRLGSTIAVAKGYGRHPITEKHKTLATFFPLARSLTTTGTIPGTEVVQLVRTSRKSWAETGLDWLKEKNTKMSYNSLEDKLGPLSLATAVVGFPKGYKPSSEHRSHPKTRIVVFGDSDFCNNQFFSKAGNGDLFLNAVNWLMGEEGLIAIRPKTRGYRPLFLTENDQEFIFWIALILLPMVPIIGGVWVWWRRR